MNRSPLFEKHKQSDASFDEFFAWRVPQIYSKIEAEYAAARGLAVIMERPYFGHLRVTGDDHVDLLHRLTANELRPLQPGEGQINIFANEKGRIIDRVLLLKFPDSIRLITSPGSSERVAAWIDKYVFIEDVKVENLTAALTTLSLFGPKSPQVLEVFFNHEFHQYHQEMDWNGQKLLVARTDELRAPGFDLIVETARAPKLWEELLAAGKPFDLRPMGEAAYEVLRIEAGWPIYGKDFDDQINPHEAGLLPYINFNKGCYIGQEVIARLDTYDKVQKHLMGVTLEGDLLPKSQDLIFVDDQEVGYLTSAVHSIGLKKNIALGYVRTKFANEGAEVQIVTDGREISGKVVALPFRIVY
jgi:folate-binding protein YgfZ